VTPNVENYPNADSPWFEGCRFPPGFNVSQI
jgi:hypothetical protein